MSGPEKQDMERQQMARELRSKAFPGATDWHAASPHVREQWLRASDYAIGRMEVAVDTWLRKAVATLHENGIHVGAKSIRNLRWDFENRFSDKSSFRAEDTKP